MAECNVKHRDETELGSEDSDEYELDIDCHFGLNPEKTCELTDTKTHPANLTKLMEVQDENITSCGDKKSIELQAEDKIITSSCDRNLLILDELQISEDKDNSTWRSHTARVSTTAWDCDNCQTACDTLTENYQVPESSQGISHSAEFVQIANKHMVKMINKLRQEGTQNEHEILKLRHNIQQMRGFDKIFSDIVELFYGDEEKADSAFSECMGLLLRSCEEVLSDSYIDQEFDKIIRKRNNCSAGPN